MAKISDLSDELLVKILSFLPTKVAVSTSILSKQWEFLWMWLPNLEFDCIDDSVKDFINKNLPLHRAPIINSLRLSFRNYFLQAATLKSWVEIAVSRGVRELSISTFVDYPERDRTPLLLLPSILYTCNSLVTLELKGKKILVDVLQTVCLPSLKTLQLKDVIYSNKDTLQVLLSNCPVLEDLTIYLKWQDNNMRILVVIIIPSLQRLSLNLEDGSSSDWVAISTPSLKYFELVDYRDPGSYLIEHMPELEEADINVMQDIEIDIDSLLKSITSVKRLTLRVIFNSGNETVYGDGILFTRLENLKLYISTHNWSKILFQLLKDSPNLQIFDLEVNDVQETDEEYKRVTWSNKKNSVPKCLLKTLKTLKFQSYNRKKEQRDVFSFIIKHARCLKSISICDGNIMQHN